MTKPPCEITMTRKVRLKGVRAAAVVFAILGVSALACAVPGCGGDAKPANYPTTDGGAPVATTESDGGKTSTRADISAAAKDAYERGWKAFNAGELSTAKQAFTEAGQKDPRSGAPHYSLGTVLEHLGDLAGAQQEYRAAFSLQPDYEVAVGAYAMSLASAGNIGEAETFLNDRHQRSPNSARITTYLAEVKSLRKDSGAAQQLAQDALKSDPDYRDAMVLIARDHYRSRRVELARYAVQAILDGFGAETPPRDKDNADANLLRGLIEREAGRRAAAMAAFEIARTKRPSMAEALVNLGVMKLEAGNAPEALPLLESAVRFSPNNAVAHLNLGDAYRLTGKPTEAKREFDTALSQDSSLAMAHYDLGLLYLFTPKMPGVSELDQVSVAIKELDVYKTMRGAKAPPGQTDDIEELSSRAKAKQAEIKNRGAVVAAASASPPPSTPSAAPSPPASAAPAASAKKTK
jgi:tetratricopeptide (TPR) repeat protein